MADEKQELTVTEETVKQFKGRVPRAVQAKRISKDKKGVIHVRSRLDLFMEEFLKNGGNGTEAALAVGSKNRVSAGRLAQIYLKNAREMGRLYLDSKGIGYGKLLDVAVKKMEENKTPEWWDRLMKIGGYEDFFAKNNGSPVSVNIIQTQEKLRNEFGFGDAVEGEEADDAT